jgi:hypothetical protein
MKRKLLKVSTVLLLLNILTTTLSPSICYALTAGPTAPEYTSFEPVDTTDMVSLATGDFTYNIPLLEVPGPEGGYPMALSYHAGITPNEEASWVGLGWSLNPGSLNRSIQGVPDDVYNASREVHDYWPGGETNIFTVGVGWTAFSVDVDIAHDTYKGNAVGISTSATLGYTNKSETANLGISATVSSGMYGQGASVGIQGSAGVFLSGSEHLGVTMGVSTNFKSISTYAGVGLSFDGASVLGASIGSNNLKPSVHMGVASMTSIQNNKAGRISSSIDGFGATIPLPYGFTLTLGSQDQRYWSDERDAMNMFGSLYAKNSFGSSAHSSIDSYILPQFEDENTSADKQKGGSFLAYDSYSVLGQGIGGTIQPYALQNTNIYRQSINDVVQFGRTDDNAQDLRLNFRFKNDFSNKFLIDRGAYPTATRTTDGFGNPFLSIASATKEFNTDFYNQTENVLAGSRHVEWVTNASIKNGSFRAKSSFIPYEGADFSERNVSIYGRDISKQIGGFVVTNVSGVSYHYSLPVYSYGEYTKLVAGDGSFKENFNNQPYAYTWLLTAITGPDFVDRGTFGLSDDDLGYWVKFDYGKWTNDFKYRTPLTGTNKDLDQGYSIYTSGKKELYYLNYIRTRTHTAIFEKDIRNDGKGVARLETGGINPQSSQTVGYTIDVGTDRELKFPVSPLKLKNIYLFENSSLNSLLSSNQGLNLFGLKGKGVGKFVDGYYYNESHQDTNTPAGQCTQLGNTYRCYSFSYGSDHISHLWNNVIDTYDIETISNFTKSALRKITLNTSYDLCPNTANSVADNKAYYEFYKAQGFGTGPVGTTVPWPVGANQNPYSYSKGGKLTLNSIEFKGMGGASIMPPTVFHYNNSDASGTYAAIATDVSNNPPYNDDKRDIWEHYKSDIDLTALQKNESFARSVSEESAAHTHVWSLKEIETPIGAKIKIEYESDEYDNVEIGTLNSMPITKVQLIDRFSLKVFLDNNNINLASFFSDYTFMTSTTPDVPKIRLVGSHKFISEDNPNNSHDLCQTDESQGIHTMVKWTNFNANVFINSLDDIGSNYIIVTISPAVDGDLPNSPTHWDVGSVNHVTNLNSTNGYIMDCQCTDHDGNSASIPYTFKNNGILVAGNAFFNKRIVNKGGGLRVKKISVNSDSQIYSTNYGYSHGSTSSLPGGYDNNFQHTDLSIHDKVMIGYQAQSRIQYINNIAVIFKNRLSFAREMPGPGVMYGTVRVSESVQDIGGTVATVKPGYKEFIFRTFNFDDNTKDVQKSSALFGDRNNSVTYSDFTSRVGNLISSTDYNANNQKIEETIYQYLHDDPSPAAAPGTLIPNSDYVNLLDNNYSKQGHIEELFNEFRVLGRDGGFLQPQTELFIYSKRIEYPSVLKKVITKNYKTGISSTSENLEFDFITGTPTKVVSTDAYGNRFVSESILAYTLDEYDDGMGIKIFNDYASGTRLSKHMLSQEAGALVYKVDNNNTPIGLTSSQVKTWKRDDYSNSFYGQSDIGAYQTTPIWRPFRTYSWTGTEQLLEDGTHDWSVYNNDLFNAWGANQSPANNSYWQKDMEITKYNEYSKVLEATDINNQYASSRMDRQNRFITASASNTKYDEMTYSGAEDFAGNADVENGVSRGEGTPSSDFAHTGSYSLKVDPTKKGFIYTLEGNTLDPTKKYWTSVWVYLPGVTEDNLSDAKLYYKVNGTTVDASPIITHKANNKFLITLKVTPNGNNSIEIGCLNNSSRAIYFDDFRVHPLGATMNSYVFNKVTNELIAILNNDNLYTRFVYDDAGRLTKTYQEFFYTTEKKVSSSKYNYGKDINE